MQIIINSIEELIGLITLFLGGVDIKQELQDMAKNIQDLSARFGDLEAALTTEIEQITDTLEELRANEAANGTPEQREAFYAKIDGAITRIQGIIPDVPPPGDEEEGTEGGGA